MRDLVRAEWFKLEKSLGFKVLLLLNALLAFLMHFSFTALAQDSMRTGSQVMESSLTLVLYHTYIAYLLAAIFVCKEFSGRTFALSLLSGYSRSKVLLSKILVFFLGILILFYEFVIVETISFSIKNGFGMEFNLETITHIMKLLGYGLIGCLTVGAVAIFVAVVVKKLVLTIGFGMILIYVMLWMETTFRENPLPFIKYMYSYQIRQVHFGKEAFSVGTFLVITLITFVAALAVSFFVFARSELK